MLQRRADLFDYKCWGGGIVGGTNFFRARICVPAPCRCVNIHCYTKQRGWHRSPFLQPPLPSFGRRLDQSARVLNGTLAEKMRRLSDSLARPQERPLAPMAAPDRNVATPPTPHPSVVFRGPRLQRGQKGCHNCPSAAPPDCGRKGGVIASGWESLTMQEAPEDRLGLLGTSPSNSEPGGTLVLGCGTRCSGGAGRFVACDPFATPSLLARLVSSMLICCGAIGE